MPWIKTFPFPPVWRWSCRCSAGAALRLPAEDRCWRCGALRPLIPGCVADDVPGLLANRMKPLLPLPDVGLEPLTMR